MPKQIKIEREVAAEEREFLEAMASDITIDDATQRRAKAVVAFLDTGDLTIAAERSGRTITTIKNYIAKFNQTGWQGLLAVPYPRGGDFLSRYDQGYWAERLARAALDKSPVYRAIPYGTSRSEPFTDMQAFREYITNEFMLQAWSFGRKWKRPDLLLIPRQFLKTEKGNDTWTPDLKHWNNDECQPYVAQAAAAIEVETSLWQVARATVPLSFTVKEEDLEALRAWVMANQPPLYIVQVFYDEAHALPFTTLERLIGPDTPAKQRVVAEVDRTTKKATYRVPLAEGVGLGTIPEPDVEGRVFKAPNGRITVYGRLVGSQIEVAAQGLLEKLAGGQIG